MAYYQAETLKARIERGPIPLAEVASIAGHIADGLTATHVAGGFIATSSQPTSS